jgi:hypothetical protein
MRKVLVIDTSVLCVWLKVPGKETCGPSNALVTYEMVSEKIEEEKKKGTTFILPLATIIETGNHIAHSSGDRMSLGEEFAQIMIDSADEKSPWAAFTEQSSLWNPENLKKLAMCMFLTHNSSLINVQKVSDKPALPSRIDLISVP